MTGRSAVRGEDLPAEVVKAYELEPDSVELIPSLINVTFSAQTCAGRALIVQRLHPVFKASVHEDIAAVTGHLKSCGLETPELVRTVGGELWIDLDGEVWRAQTRLDGETVHHVTSPVMARAAARLVASFHRCLDGFDHHFAFQRSGVHDTPRHLERLRAARARANAQGDGETAELAQSILSTAANVTLDFGSLPQRICHGDLKISNILFASTDPSAPVARCLIDLDTLGYLPLAHELGDALRSWCNAGAEDIAQVHFDSEVFEAALSGYAEAAPPNISTSEWSSIVPGLIAICLELSARFCVDAIEDTYFGWDPNRFATRREHNLARARSQLKLGELVIDQQEQLQRLAAGVGETLLARSAASQPGRAARSKP